MKRKAGDRVVVKSKYFNLYNDLEGIVESIDDHYEKITVRIDHVENLQEFDKTELKGIKP